MRRLPLIGAVAFTLIGLAAACTDPISQNPMGPGAPTVAGLQISGPSTIAPGQSAQLTADVRLSNGAVKSSTTAQNIRWRSSNPSVLQVNDSGFAIAGPTPGDATITAEVLPTANPRGTREIVVVPDGTFRLAGSVREAASPTPPIAGALVEISGTALVAATDGSGNYRLFGVPPAAEIRVSANGFLPDVRNVQLGGHSTQNFNLVASGPRLSLNGLFRVAIDVEGACAGNPGLPPDLQHRTYEATASTLGAGVDVRLTEPRFRIFVNQGNRFFGRATPGSVSFTLSSLYSYYYYYYPSIAEQLPDNTILVPAGTAITTPAGGGLSGPMTGSIFHYDSRFPAFNSTILGRCSPAGLRLTLTPR